MNVSEPVTPVRICELVVQLMLDDLGEVQLRRVPTADPVVGPEVSIDLEAVGGRCVPLEQKLKVFCSQC